MKNERDNSSNKPSSTGGKRELRNRVAQRLRQSGSDAGKLDRTRETSGTTGEFGGTNGGDRTDDRDDTNTDELERGEDSGNRIDVSETPDSPRRVRGRTTNRRNDNGDRSNRDNGTTEETEERIVEGSPWRSPASLSFATLHQPEQPGKKKTVTARKHKTVNRVDIEGLQAGFQLLFKVPPMFLGKDHKEHWDLDDKEAEELSTTFVKALGETDNKNLKLLLEFLTKYMPILTFLACFYIVMSSRIEDSTRLINERKRTKSSVPGHAGIAPPEPQYSPSGPSLSEAASYETVGGITG